MTGSLDSLGVEPGTCGTCGVLLTAGMCGPRLEARWARHANVAQSKQSVLPVPVGLSRSAFSPCDTGWTKLSWQRFQRRWEMRIPLLCS